MPHLSLDSLAEEAAAGDWQAVDEILAGVVEEVYRLSLRMRWHPDDAEEATEPILLEVVSALLSAQIGSDIRVGVFRLAARHLLSAAPSPMERQQWTFAAMSRDLLRGTDEVVPATLRGGERRTAADEVEVGCSQTMLLCLDRDHRIAYLLAELHGFDAETGARVLSLDPQTFRRRVDLAHEALHGFMQQNCGLLNEGAACRCDRRLGRALRTGRVDLRSFLFVTHPARDKVVRLRRKEEEPAAVLQAQRLAPAPHALLRRVCAQARTERTPVRLRA